MLKNTTIIVKDSRWLLDLFSVTDLIAKLNGPNTEFRDENKIIAEMIGATDSLKGKLKLRKNQLKRCANPLPKCLIARRGYIWCVCLHSGIYCDTLLTEYERRSKNSGRMKFTVSFITDRFEREILSRVLNWCPLRSWKIWASYNLRLLIANRLISENKKTDWNFWKLILSVHCPVLKRGLLKVNGFFGSAY
jgi:hypothetical protein